MSKKDFEKALNFRKPAPWKSVVLREANNMPTHVGLTFPPLTRRALFSLIRLSRPSRAARPSAPEDVVFSQLTRSSRLIEMLNHTGAYSF